MLQCRAFWLSGKYLSAPGLEPGGKADILQETDKC